jgi:hypothetical protein
MHFSFVTGSGLDLSRHGNLELLDLTLSKQCVLNYH